MNILKIIAMIILISVPYTAQAQYVPTSQKQVKLSFAPLVKQTAPAVVNIYTKRNVQKIVRQQNPFSGDPFFEQFFGQRFGQQFGRSFEPSPEGQVMTKERVQSALGSGVIVDPSGLIISNAHVIKGADEIIVVLSDGQEFKAKQVFLDERIDLALLKVDTKGKALTALTPKGDRDLEVGDLVLAIGNPFGVGQTVTSGIVSATARSAAGVSNFNFFIQTDAAINPGNSGGALIDMDGNLVGINTAIFSRNGGSLGIGFAIPSSMISAVLMSSKQGSKILRKPWIGAKGQNVTSDLAKTLGLKNIKGSLLTSVQKEGPADKAGLKAGDVIVALNDRAITGPVELRFELSVLPIGSPVDLKVWRKGKFLHRKMLASLPPETIPRNETLMTGAGNIFAGAVLVNLSPAMAEELSMQGDALGVVVLDVESKTRMGLRKKDIIQNVNGQVIETVEQLKEILRSKTNRWQVRIKRGKQIIDVMVSG